MSIDTESYAVPMNFRGWHAYPGLPLVAVGLVGIAWALVGANSESWKTTLALLRLATGWTVLSLLVTAQRFRKPDVGPTGGIAHALPVYR